MTDRVAPRRLTALLALAPLAAGTMALATEWATNTDVLDPAAAGSAQQAAPPPSTVSPLMKRRIERAMRKLDATRTALNHLELTVQQRAQLLKSGGAAHPGSGVSVGATSSGNTSASALSSASSAGAGSTGSTGSTGSSGSTGTTGSSSGSSGSSSSGGSGSSGSSGSSSSGGSGSSPAGSPAPAPAPAPSPTPAPPTQTTTGAS